MRTSATVLRYAYIAYLVKLPILLMNVLSGLMKCLINRPTAWSRVARLLIHGVLKVYTAFIFKGYPSRNREPLEFS
jgi:hypothetical protein